MTITGKTLKYMGVKKLGGELDAIWDSNLSPDAIENALDDLIEDLEAPIQEFMDAITQYSSIAMRNPIYRSETKGWLLSKLQEIASKRSELHSLMTDITFAAAIAKQSGK